MLFPLVGRRAGITMHRKAGQQSHKKGDQTRQASGKRDQNDSGRGGKGNFAQGREKVSEAGRKAGQSKSSPPPRAAGVPSLQILQDGRHRAAMSWGWRYPAIGTSTPHFRGNFFLWNGCNVRSLFRNHVRPRLFDRALGC